MKRSSFYSKSFTGFITRSSPAAATGCFYSPWRPAEDNPYFYHILHLLKQGGLQRWEQCWSQCSWVRRVEHFLANQHPIFNYIWGRTHSEREEVLLSVRPRWHMNTGWLTKSLKGPVAHIWVGIDPLHCQSPSETGKKKVGCPVHSQPSQVGWNFCRHQLFKNHLR